MTSHKDVGRTPRQLHHALAVLLVAAVLVAGCERSPAALGLVEVHERLYDLKWGSPEAQVAEAQSSGIDPRDLSYAQVLDGASVQFLSVSELVDAGAS